MALTPETLPRHELNGLPVRVVESDDSSRVGIEGRVVIETTKTLSIEVRTDGESRVVMVPKSGSTFEFAITDDAADPAKGSGTASKLADTQPGAAEQSVALDRAAGDAGSHRGDPERDHRAAGEDVAYVTVDGSRLLSRPARRTETNGDSPWQ
ncbi:ribonuclease P protein component 1 [Natrinema pellirubrum DSM 15624]|uniref:Ribonuclease P protein component 1 n=1 Tax=Natrinema pellirubrum (strain DSM 15624 / CIP 106293 / JCM 10476 / NCIMB 786 / 157) TaxID=797303 RepID=L0JHN0_NATP1|nr:ribonuclease P protein component 1 [Natrinema pellirubrum]AGB30794.1 RNase P/RNase MRP subunit p29 [Natrinema pellirubrum DSM 15624]ELY80820.1 ribonuclease P protein component 1 [Natrinema pellirubrum DSM 15624]